MSQHESPTHARAAAPLMLPATLRLGAVHLTVSNLGRSVAFYEDAMGLRLHRREDGAALREALARTRIFFMVSGAEDRDGIKLLLEGLRDRLPRHHANGRGAPGCSPLSSQPAAWCGSHHVRRSLPSLADTA